MRLLIMGPPGAGKGTQGKLIAEYLEIPAISTGEIFRQHRDQQTELGREVQRIIDAGDYVPDSITERVVAERLAQPDARHGFLLDGFPRTVHQADMLDKMLGDDQLDGVLSLGGDPDVMVQRMLGRAHVEGRADDTEETIRYRMKVYEETTEPVLTAYRMRGILIPVNSDGSVDEVTASIRDALDALSSRTGA